MKNYNITNIILILAICVLVNCSCKQNKIENGIKYDQPSMDEMIANYQKVTEGDFRSTAHESLNTDLTKYVSTGGFGGVIYDTITRNFDSLKQIKLGKLYMNQQEIPFYELTKHYGGTQEQLDNFFPYLYDNKDIKIKLYDKNDINVVVEFNYKSPKILQSKIEDGFKVDVNTADLNKTFLNWNADNNNKVGIIAVINHNGIDNAYIPLADDGREPLSNIIKNNKGFVVIWLYRGSIIIKKGIDNRNYKITNVVDSYCSINVH